MPSSMQTVQRVALLQDSKSIHFHHLSSLGRAFSRGRRYLDAATDATKVFAISFNRSNGHLRSWYKPRQLKLVLRTLKLGHVLLQHTM